MSLEFAIELFCDWYEIPSPKLRSFQTFPESKFADIWTMKWFAKKQQQTIMDQYLQKYKPLFDVNPEDLKEEEMSKEIRLIIDIAFVILWDQVSRNVFRNSAQAYTTDKKARVLVESIMPFWASLPLPIRISCILVYIHSEDLDDLKTVERLVHDVSDPMKNYESVFQSLKGIAKNHRERMTLFGRIPERNRFVNRISTEKELAYMSTF